MIVVAAAFTAALLPGTLSTGAEAPPSSTNPAAVQATGPSSAHPTLPAGFATVAELRPSGHVTSPTQPDQPATPVNCKKVKCIALTFDDGPVRQTAQVLDVLRQRGAHATFFVQGIQAAPRTKLLRRMAAEGNAVGNHSWNHPMFTHLSNGAIQSQLRRTDAVITKAIGPHRKLVRTPFGQADKRILKALRTFGAPEILWSVDPEDWKYRNTKVVERKVLHAARRNSIVLMHDIRPTTRAAVATIVDRLQAKGYVLVTVPELLGGRLHPGGRYARG